MKLIYENYSGKNTINLMRKIGYFYLEEKSGPSFVRPLNPNGYPRFHIYLETEENKKGVILNLHLDQKRPSYNGTSAHAGEYESPVVEQEMERIKQVFQKNK